ncbi:hypothetical protein GIB67_003438 [Kingdonia uniflora]|uniref:DNA repair protein UVH3 n=1 Tax=Kingdonia uniflora TaxID=39325 RepID=A0A7J7P9D2_9MAGN|nr:hypothetical protein GIB67_003438 [Kingdonia uniflora]
MGVQGLWELLSPVGRRVSVETLAGKKLAIDASIWMVQFMKAMRDERGEMVTNAHILGFFRRICKLLFLRTKPVFVFDGGTPALKKRTVIARRRQREKAKAKIRKTAEKLLLNRLKEMRLKEIAKDIENQRQKNDSKGKNIIRENAELVESSSKKNNEVTGRINQDTLDELLAASLAAEEDGRLTGNASTAFGGSVSVGGVVSSEEDDEDEDEEMILPVMHGKVNPSVLAALPPSMQLELLGQMRERLMAENRQKYQKVKKAPAKFSELQIQSYLKTIAFRREISDVQKSAAGKGIGGMQTSRIASEANREYIFSSSFTGDKQTLTSTGVEKSGDVEHQGGGKEPISSNPIDCFPSSAQTFAVEGFEFVNESGTSLGDDVETYVDERGHLRVSRGRAMGIRMTRDLQRNLDLMNEKEQEKMKEKSSSDLEAFFNEEVFGASERLPIDEDILKVSDDENDEVISLNGARNTAVEGGDNQVFENKAAISISLQDNDQQKTTDDDDLFAYLVASSAKDASECSWEEGNAEEKKKSFSTEIEEESRLCSAKVDISDEIEVDWEEGDSSAVRHGSPCQHKEVSSRGSLAEAADIEEAIKKSLEDFTKEKSVKISTDIRILRELVREGTTTGLSFQDSSLKNDMVDSLYFPVCNEFTNNGTSQRKRDNLEMSELPETQLTSSIGFGAKSDVNIVMMNEPCESGPFSEAPCKNSNSCTLDISELPERTLKSPIELDVKIFGKAAPMHETCESCPDFEVPCRDPVACVESTGNHLVRNDPELAQDHHSYETTKVLSFQDELNRIEIGNDVHIGSNLVSQKSSAVSVEIDDHTKENMAVHDNMEAQTDLSETNLDEEMLLLRKERINLGEEQRKHERNAESVNSEMFAECQELLQMFGLPYIIAPMEAEAQCAFMELANLVDGVVTDDSDVFLFGARSVYKNIFDNRKYVETYFMKDIESELGLTREQLIRMALLLGSDYTEGVSLQKMSEKMFLLCSGIGIVNAIEVVNAFPEEDGLQKFREWFESPDPTILGTLNGQNGAKSKKRKSKVKNDDGSFNQGQEDNQPEDDIDDTRQIFMDKHRNISKNWHISSSFPSEAVISAYVSPQVDRSTEAFSWGKLDLFVLRKLCWDKFGWSNQKADELLVPVLKEYNKHETQLRLEAFYTFNERFAKVRSQRIKKAVKGIRGSRSSELVDVLPQEASKARKKIKVSPSGPELNLVEKIPNGDKIIIGGSKSSISEKPTPKLFRNRTGGKRTKKGSTGSTRGKGRGRGKGLGKGKGKGKGKETSHSESTETSSNDGSNEDELVMQVENLEKSSEVRRSTRPRKEVKSTVNYVKTHELKESADQIGKKCISDGTIEQESGHTDSETMEHEPAHGEGRPENTDFNLIDKVDDHSLKKRISTNFLKSGGGFCIEDVNQGNEPTELGFDTSNVYNDHISPKEGVLTDYLQMGGGFCMGEDEQETDTLFQSVFSPRNLCELANSVQADKSTKPNLSLEELQKVETSTIDTGSRASTTGLTPMPFLRRKRRKF